jgi:hypothetical protein
VGQTSTGSQLGPEQKPSPETCPEQPRTHGTQEPSRHVFGLLVIGVCAGAFLAPPFTGLDTLPSLGVVLLSLGVLLEDIVVVLVALVVGVAGVLLEVVLGSAVINAPGKLV